MRRSPGRAGVVNGYPDRHASGIRRLLAERLELSARPDRAGQRRLRPPPLGRALAAVGGRRARHAVAVLPALPADRGACRAPPGPHRATTKSPTQSPRTRGPWSSAIRTIRPAPTCSSEDLGLPPVVPARGRTRAARRGARALPGRRGPRCLPAIGRRLPAPAGRADLLEDLRALRASRGLRGELGLTTARGGGARAGRERADPGRGGARPEHGDAEIQRRRHARVPRAQLRSPRSCASWART